MKNILTLFLFGWFVISCRSSDGSLTKEKQIEAFTAVAFHTLMEDTLSIRAVNVIQDKIWYVSQQGRYGALDFEGNVIFEGTIERDNTPHPLRGISTDGLYVYLMAIQKPATIYRHLLSDLSVFEKVFEDNHPNAFLNTIIFDKNGRGIAYGDSYDQELYLLNTDNGQHWKRVKNNQLFFIDKEEHAFAASNSVAAINNNEIWLATGGSQSRVLYSGDFGNSWHIQSTPILSGSQMKGIFSMDFYNNRLGILAGGDYNQPELSDNNLAITLDGGKLWKQVLHSPHQTSPGFISCVKFVPRGGGEHIVTVGSNGIYYSANAALTWKKLSEESALYTIQFIDYHKAVAAGKNKIILLDFSID